MEFELKCIIGMDEASVDAISSHHNNSMFKSVNYKGKTQDKNKIHWFIH